MIPYRILQTKAGDVSGRKSKRSTSAVLRTFPKSNTARMRGITLLISVIISSVVLSVALALLDISYKQQILASSAKESQKAFYNADTAMECALYWDQQKDAFDFIATSFLKGGIQCNGQTIIIWDAAGANIAPNYSNVATDRTTFYQIPCAGGGLLGQVTVGRSSTGATTIYVSGYSTCTITDPRRIERGLKISY